MDVEKTDDLKHSDESGYIVWYHKTMLAKWSLQRIFAGLLRYFWLKRWCRKGYLKVFYARSTDKGFRGTKNLLP